MRQGWMLFRPIIWSSVFVTLLPSNATAADEAPLPNSRLGYRTAPLLLLSRPDVRADLGMSAEQTASAQRAVRTMYVQAASLRKKPNTEETVRARRLVDESMQAWLDSELSADQKSRLVQIDLQWEGPSALVSRPIIAEALNLSKEQIATLEAAISRRDESRRKGHADAERVLAESTLASLSESQRESWRRLLGKAFTPQVAEKAEAKATR